MSVKINTMITDRILESLNNLQVPWRKPWVSQMPTSLNTQTVYRGINNLLLSHASDSPTQLYLTFNQVKNLGGLVRKGCKALPVVYHVFKEDDETGESKYMGVRYYRVFAVEDTTLQQSTIDALLSEDMLERLKNTPPSDHVNTAVESFLAQVLTSTQLSFKSSNKAYYMPSTHTIAMPCVDSFDKYSEYYATYFHELVHSTMAECGRDAKGYKFGSHKYSFEELVAEIGAQFLCDYFQIQNAPVENSTAYINAWLTKLNGDRNMVIKAASKAQKAVDFLLSKVAVPF